MIIFYYFKLLNKEMSSRLVLFNYPSTCNCVTCLVTPNVAHFRKGFVFIEKSPKSKDDHPTNTTIFVVP